MNNKLWNYNIVKLQTIKHILTIQDTIRNIRTYWGSYISVRGGYNLMRNNYNEVRTGNICIRTGYVGVKTGNIGVRTG